LTIRGEEKKAFALLEKAEKEVPRLVQRRGMSGSTLAILHHTHGYDPEIVAAIAFVPRKTMEDYHADMEKERERSRSAIVRKPVTVQKP
jgi:alanyl-tRNA synthetase